MPVAPDLSPRDESDLHGHNPQAVRDRLLDMLQGLEARQTATVIVEGVPGSGRTWTIDAVAELAKAAGFEVLRYSEIRPQSFFADGPLPIDRPQDERGVLVTVDDIERCDLATVVSSLILGVRHGRPALWVGTTTPDARVRDAIPLLRNVDATLHLGEVATAQIEEWVTSSGADVGDRLLREALSLIPSHPKPVLETIAFLRTHEQASPWPACLFKGVEGDPEVVAAIASLGDEFYVDDVAAVLGVTVASVVRPLSDAVRAGILSGDGEKLKFVHRLVREEARRIAPPQPRLLLQAVQVLIKRGSEPSALVEAVWAAIAQEQEIASLLADAVTVIARSDALAAARIARWGLDRILAQATRRVPEPFGSVSESPQQTRLRDEATSRWLACLGPTGGLELARQEIEHFGRPGPETLFIWSLLECASDPQEALRLARRGLAYTELTPRQRTRLESLEVLTGVIAGEQDAPARLRSALVNAEEQEDLRAIAIARLGFCMADLAQGNWLAAFNEATFASNGAVEDPLAQEYWLAGVVRAKMLNDMGRPTESQSVIRALAEPIERSGRLLGVPMLLIVEASRSMAAADFHRAENLLVRARTLEDTFGRTGMVWLSIVQLLSRIARLRGDLAGAAEYRAELDRFPPEHGKTRVIGEHIVLADEVGSDTFDGRSGWVGDVDEVSRLGLAHELTDEIGRIRILHSIGDHDRTAAVAQVIRSIAASSSFELGRAAAVHGDALINRDARGVAESIRRYHDAGRPVLEAWAHEDLSDIVASEAPVAAAESLRRAHAIWAGAGAHREAARVSLRLRDMGIRLPAVPDDRTSIGRQIGVDLTAAEERVVRELLLGRTNAEIASALFLSPNTVAVHLRRIYAKTDIRSRADLIELVRSTVDLGAPDAPR